MFQSNRFSEDPFNELKNRIQRRMRADSVEEKMLQVAQDKFAQILRAENIILSRVEQKRLLQAILKEMFNDILKSL